MTHDAADNDDLDLTGDADPLLEVVLADALGPYLRALSPEEIEDYRRFLTVFITTHPAAAALDDRLRARHLVLSESGTVAREGADVGEAAPEPADGTFGGRR